MKKFLNSITVWFMVCIIVLSNLIFAEAKTVLTVKQTEEYINIISKQQMSTYPNPKFGTTGGEWSIMFLARYGSITEEYVELYKKNLGESLNKCKGVLSDKKYTEYARVVIALTSIGENAESFKGYNLVKPLYDIDKVRLQGINGVAYALIAISTGNYSNPKDETGKTVTDILVEEILQAQLEDGGWCLSGNRADTDLTAICIQALIPYMENKKIKKAVEMAFDRLSELQCESGGFATMGTETCESTAQVLVALAEAGVSIEDKRFVKNGNTILDGLLVYYKNKGFSHLSGMGKNIVATEQAAYALVSYYRSVSGMNRLYDMRDGLVYKKIEDSVKENSKVSIEEHTKNQIVIKENQNVDNCIENEQQANVNNDKKTNSKSKKNKCKTNRKNVNKNNINTEESDFVEESVSVSEKENIYETEKIVEQNNKENNTEDNLKTNVEIDSKKDNVTQTEKQCDKEKMRQTDNEGNPRRIKEALLALTVGAICGCWIYIKKLRSSNEV